MKNSILKVAVLAFLGLSIYACSDDDNADNNNSVVTKKQVIENYANIVHANYKKAYDDAVILETAINTFTASPTAANFTAAKDRWKDSRESYGTTEAFRFANGPIDATDDSPEGLINSWPLDESYIDYAVDEQGILTNGGIVNSTDVITKEALENANGDGAEDKVSVGYHAIEFLLWGQDLTAPSENKPGQRLFTDYTTAANATRRAAYLKICADLLTDHLAYLVDQWKPGGEYRTTFLALNEDVAIKNIYLGISTLAAAELAIERMDVALLTESQEDEHSCFSDNTHRDIALNLQGIVNVYEGKYGDIDGASLQDLVNQADTAIGFSTDTSVTNAKAKIAAIKIPFDDAISGGLESVEGAKVRVAVRELEALGANFIAGASKIGIAVNG